jgi:L-ascorbate metabolism protein UlaG (beta-lactamase superfamily)
MALIRELFRPDLAMLPIGGHFTMDPAAAALAAELLGVQHVLPIHWGTYPALAGTPQQLVDAITARGGTARVHAWSPGDSLD